MISEFVIHTRLLNDFTVTAGEFRSALDHWAPYAVLTEPAKDDPVIDVTAVIRRPGETSFLISRSRNGNQISIQGTPEQIAETAVWATNAFACTGDSELWITNPTKTGHTTLLPGMSTDEVWDDWLDHY